MEAYNNFSLKECQKNKKEGSKRAEILIHLNRKCKEVWHIFMAQLGQTDVKILIPNGNGLHLSTFTNVLKLKTYISSLLDRETLIVTLLFF